MPPFYTNLRANLTERFAPAGVDARAGYVIAILCASVVHVALLGFLLIDYRQGAVAAPEAIEIPVELVAAPPPPPPEPAPPPADKPKSEPPPPPDLEPAHDAPRDPTKDKIERDASDKITKAPPAPPVETPGAEPTIADLKGPAQEGAPQAPAALEAPSADKAEETLPPPQPQPDKALEKPAQAEEAKIEPPKPQTPPGRSFPSFESVPDVDFGAAALDSPVGGGKAKRTYLTIIYGMIMNRMHVPPPRGAGGGQGSVVFVIDGFGNVRERHIEKASGRRELDAAALEAVGKASPFPPTPNGLPVGLTFAYTAQ